MQSESGAVVSMGISVECSQGGVRFEFRRMLNVYTCVVVPWLMGQHIFIASDGDQPGLLLVYS